MRTYWYEFCEYRGLLVSSLAVKHSGRSSALQWATDMYEPVALDYRVQTSVALKTMVQYPISAKRKILNSSTWWEVRRGQRPGSEAEETKMFTKI
jgi:hypothetical protein